MEAIAITTTNKEKVTKFEYSEKDKITLIPIEKIKTNLIKIRQEGEIDDNDDAEFKDSIKNKGFTNPIQVNDSFSIIDGHRRYNVAKELGITHIPCIIITGVTTKEDYEDIALIQNTQSQKYSSEEVANAIIRRFGKFGYTSQQIRLNINKIRNNSPKSIDPKFLKVYNSLEKLGFKNGAHSIFQLLQIVMDIPDDVKEEVKKKELSLGKKILLTHSKLRDHPKVQKMLVSKIANATNDEAKVIVNQTINDLQTGAIEVNEEGGYSYDYDKREDRPEIAKGAIEYYTSSVIKANDLLRELTGHQLTKGEYKYLDKHVIHTENHRKMIISSLDERAAMSLEELLKVTRMAIDSTLNLLAQKLE